MIIKIFNRFQKQKQLRNIKKFTSAENLKIGINNEFILYPTLKKIIFGKDIHFRNYINIRVEDDAELLIGDQVFINNSCSINSLVSISIGEKTLFGENVKIYDHNHQYETLPQIKIHHQKFTKSPVKIGKNCWLGSNVVVLKGVTIGDNCIIGAGCTVHKDIPSNSIVINKQEHIVKSIIV